MKGIVRSNSSNLKLQVDSDSMGQALEITDDLIKFVQKNNHSLDSINSNDCNTAELDLLQSQEDLRLSEMSKKDSGLQPNLAGLK